MASEIEYPDMPRTRQRTETVPDHEILMVFDSDADAGLFAEWLENTGWGQFASWRRATIGGTEAADSVAHLADPNLDYDEIDGELGIPPKDDEL